MLRSSGFSNAACSVQVTASDQRADSDDESEEAQELVDWQCVICDKLFRSEKALANHERCLPSLARWCCYLHAFSPL